MGSFYHSLETELVHRPSHRTRWEAEADLFQYIEASYHRGRGHSALGLTSPGKYEKIKSAV